MKWFSLISVLNICVVLFNQASCGSISYLLTEKGSAETTELDVKEQSVQVRAHGTQLRVRRDHSPTYHRIVTNSLLSSLPDPFKYQFHITYSSDSVVIVLRC